MSATLVEYFAEVRHAATLALNNLEAMERFWPTQRKRVACWYNGGMSLGDAKARIRVLACQYKHKPAILVPPLVLVAHVQQQNILQ